MRDPERIERVLALVRLIWSAYPDLRLSQILFNARPDGSPSNPEFYYMEDEDLESRLRKFYRDAVRP